MKFSFIIPALNEEKLIGRCIESIKAQGGEDIEIIVVDNGSTDNTVQVAKELGAKVYKEKKKGPSHARNKGAQKASGDILVFLDADNELTKNWLKYANKAFSKEKVSAVVGIDIFKHDNPIKEIWYNTYTVFVYGTSILSNTLINKPFLACRNFAIRRQVFEKLGGWEDTVGEDIWLSKKFWKLPDGKGLVNLGMISYVSSRGFEAEGYLKTLAYWAKATLKKKSLEGYSYKSRKGLFD